MTPNEELREAVDLLNTSFKSPRYVQLRKASQAVLAALEKAQADSELYRQAIDKAIQNANGRWSEWGERAEVSFGYLFTAIAAADGGESEH
jgi:hypothetical protein